MDYNPCAIAVDGTAANAEPTGAFVRGTVSGMGGLRYLHRNFFAKPEGKKTIS